MEPAEINPKEERLIEAKCLLVGGLMILKVMLIAITSVDSMRLEGESMGTAADIILSRIALNNYLDLHRYLLKDCDG